ncbi:MAG: Ig-like domain-containing protein [Bacteroidales bacterium]|nr:Ig-like domain-containing protein [Bacteroidales bacterium]
MKKIFILTGILLFSVSIFAQVQRFNSDVENEGTSCSVTIPTSFNTPNANLPDPFLKLNGQRMTTTDEWTCRRQEILKLLEATCYGTKPAKPSSVSGTVSRTSISVNAGGATFSVTITMPSGGSAPYPLVIRYDNSGVPAANFTSNGVAVANFTTSNVGGGSRTNKTGAFYTANSSYRATGHLAAWAWGVSRIIDVIEADPNKLFDPTKIGVTGCSRDGKGAFAAGVLDQRIALTMPMESGTGGMASMRVAYNNRDQGGGTNGAQSPSSAYGEQPWLGDVFSSFQNNPNNLPIDMHEAIALVAPRGFLAVYKTAASAGQWLNVPGSHVSAVAGAEVYKALGVGGNFGWLNTGTAAHCSWVSSYDATVKDFIDIFLHRTKTPGTAPIFTENNRPAAAASMINWTTPTLASGNPDAPIVALSAPAPNTTLESPATIQISATATSPAGNTITKVEFYQGTTKLGEKASAPYTYTWSNVQDGTYNITAVATDSKGNKTTSQAAVATVFTPFKIFKVPTPITIDGTIDEQWNHASVVAIQASKVLTGTVANAADLSGTCKALWDNTYLYILAEIKDNVLNNDSDRVYDDDCVEIYIDIDNAKSSSYGTKEVQFSFAWDDGGTVGVLPTERSTTGVQYVDKTVTGGYIIEARIPWTTVQGTASVGKVIGFDFMVNDDDNGGTRDKKISWNADTDDAWQNPSLYGIATLEGELSCTAPPKPTVVSPITYTEGDVATALTASGQNIIWYSQAVGGTGSTTAPTPSTQTAGEFFFYPSQTVGGCESERSEIKVIVEAAPLIIPETVQLKAGWNLVGCPITGETNLQVALQSIWHYVEQVKDMDSFYIHTNTPALNSLQTLTYGCGYFIYVSSQCSLSW